MTYSSGRQFTQINIHFFHNSIIWCVLFSMHQIINNGNWTGGSAIWSEIIHILSTLNKCAVWVKIWNDRFNFWPKLSSTQFNFTLSLSVLNLHKLIAEIQEVQDSGQNQNMPNNFYFFIYFPAMWLVSLKKALASD